MNSKFNQTATNVLFQPLYRIRKMKNSILKFTLAKGKGILCDTNSLKGFTAIEISIQAKLDFILNKFY